MLYVYVFPGNRFEGIKFAHFRIFFFASWKREKFAEEFFLSLSRERREKGRFEATEEEERSGERQISMQNELFIKMFARMFRENIHIEQRTLLLTEQNRDYR